jgi:hypothetical protein
MHLFISRLLIALVLFWNLQCALAFLAWPGNYTSGFELTGVVGEAMVRGMGVLFLMWNVPYAVAFWNPVRYRVSLYEALAMQTIGLVGESAIYLALPAVHSLARASVARFILFDALGLLALLAALLISNTGRKKPASAPSPG